MSRMIATKTRSNYVFRCFFCLCVLYRILVVPIVAIWWNNWIFQTHCGKSDLTVDYSLCVCSMPFFGPTFIKLHQLDQWVKNEPNITLRYTLLHLQLRNSVSCRRVCTYCTSHISATVKNNDNNIAFTIWSLIQGSCWSGLIRVAFRITRLRVL